MIQCHYNTRKFSNLYYSLLQICSSCWMENKGQRRLSCENRKAGTNITTAHWPVLAIMPTLSRSAHFVGLSLLSSPTNFLLVFIRTPSTSSPKSSHDIRASVWRLKAQIYRVLYSSNTRNTRPEARAAHNISSSSALQFFAWSQYPLCRSPSRSFASRSVGQLRALKSENERSRNIPSHTR